MTRFFLLIAGILITDFAFSQFSISGNINDQDGKPVASAHVLLKNTFAGAYSAGDGNYIIKNLKAGTYNVEISFIGYKKIYAQIRIDKDVKHDFCLEESVILSEEVVVQANALSAKSPVAYSDLSKNNIEKDNTGQDITYMMSLTPSMVVSSDAGTGIGYTGINIRGTDVKRINVCVNGIPLNDPESHGVFWVNMPDFATSVQNIQIQRGVGTSTNGAGAFGATINMQTSVLNEDPYAEIASSAGSFSTFKNTVSFGTGLLKKHFSFDARLSKINSDGFIDRAFSDLKSFYISGGWYSKAGILKLTIFSGKEITYQAWNGVPKVRLNNDGQGMQTYLDNWLYSQEEYDHMLNSNNRTYNYYTYENEIDHYQQDHYQIHYSKELAKGLFINAAVHYTYGRGYYEGYKSDKKFSSFALPVFVLNNDTVKRTDFITQKWLDNDFYGGLASVRYVKGKLDFVAGGGYNNYQGDHFGKIIWAKIVTFNDSTKNWYNGNGDKTDINVFAKASYQISNKINVYGDIQFRNIDYKITGNDDDLREIGQSNSYNFFNPKAGITFNPTSDQKIYLSFGTANREPSRSDFTDADSGKIPRPEKLMDYELGYIFSRSSFFAGINVFYMDYKDQLIMTGQINNVGSSIMVNVPESYRSGIEIEGAAKISDKINLNANCSFSSHKILNYTEYVDDWDNWTQVSKSIEKSDISFSPNVVAGASVVVEPIKKLYADLRFKYVSRQYIDNSSSIERSLDPYYTSDFILSYKLIPKWTAGIELQFKIVNLFNHEYETYAWAYRYILGGEEFTMDGYFPQAGRNYMAGLVMKF